MIYLYLFYYSIGLLFFFFLILNEILFVILRFMKMSSGKYFCISIEIIDAILMSFFFFFVLWLDMIRLLCTYLFIFINMNFSEINQKNYTNNYTHI